MLTNKGYRAKRSLANVREKLKQPERKIRSPMTSLHGSDDEQETSLATFCGTVTWLKATSFAKVK